ncbi:hypothetical protein B0H13DRAFT_875831 [Mycena leptocephala]|nr:hypothetical protein B0H13DRAFT_875831 [Mycena leptocephala]
MVIFSSVLIMFCSFRGLDSLLLNQSILAVSTLELISQTTSLPKSKFKLFLSPDLIFSPFRTPDPCGANMHHSISSTPDILSCPELPMNNYGLKSGSFFCRTGKNILTKFCLLALPEVKSLQALAKKMQCHCRDSKYLDPPAFSSRCGSSILMKNQTRSDSSSD